ncbi:hypothetical protein [Thermoanaerobacterium sp. R66]|uniref:hypothetical protein n=1 Tax=Thermoanaerobacterium sp. R66 TaxID=2742479 RepID=UPI00237FEA2C|nr:hypothetical protein [Thermoanaerobacterium sp. R66]MDE4542280.1 hypothetical protein [Thermoanaerobacterium sp. R66]
MNSLMSFTKKSLDWDSEQVKIALAKVDEVLKRIKKRSSGIYKRQAIETVFAKYTGVYRNYYYILQHLRKTKKKEELK